MSEEEKRAVERIKSELDVNEFMPRLVFRCEDVEKALNLIENQQKELNNLKEIEKSHQEENGKLRVELEQEKEKNKDLEEKLKIAVAMLTKGTYPEQNEGDNDFDKQFIAIDKLKDLKEFYITECKNKNITLIPAKNLFENINILLEEK